MRALANTWTRAGELRAGVATRCTPMKTRAAGIRTQQRTIISSISRSGLCLRPSSYKQHAEQLGSRTALRAAAAEVADAAVAAPAKVVFERRFDEQNMDVKVVQDGGKYNVSIICHDSCNRVLHWGADDWNKPDEVYWPAGTYPVDDKAVQTPFENGTAVRISIPEASCPTTLVFVLKELEPEKWISGGSSHFTVVIKQPDASTIANKVINAEATYTNWSLFNRLCMVNEVLDAATIAGADGMALIFTWLRLSSNRVLPWYKNSNYQSKDIAHVQKTVAQNMAEKAKGHEDPLAAMYARMALAGLPRGGGNGDDIRMGILNIMRGNGIKEGHRPGIDERFLEEWHQKLHTNTTPDDIAICEAYLAFLHTNNHDDYWRVLWERGNLTRDDLENFGKPIKAWPMHLPHLIDPFKGYLWTLKVTHSGADLDTAFTMAQGLIDDDLKWNISDLLQNRNEWWAPGKIVEVRQRLADYWKQPGSSRDILLLDIALDNWFRTLVERNNMQQLDRDVLVDMSALILRNAVISVNSPELRQCLSLWEMLQGRERWTSSWSLMALAAVQRTELSLAGFMDTVYRQVQPYAERFGKECQLDEKYIINFGEEVVRGHPAFVLSAVAQVLEPAIREAAGVSSWQIVSQTPAAGTVRAIASLEDIQGQEFSEPTILVAQHVGGMEDIPANVTAVLTRSLTDVLSHVSIRARSQKTLLATCFCQAEWDGLMALEGKHAGLQISADGRLIATEEAAGSPGSAQQGGASANIALAPVDAQMDGPYALAESEFQDKRVGRKSLNLSKLRGAIPDWINVPSSVALPYGTFERVLSHNPAVASELANLLNSVSQKDASSGLEELQKAQELVSTSLQAPNQLILDVAAKAAAGGLIANESEWAPGSAGWSKAWSAICSVWASKWTQRAWLSMRTYNLPDNDLYMACLLQQVVPAEYAFVLHTANPVSHDESELVGELVVGMGETLVGNHPGRALSFSASTAGSPPTVNVLGYPSKRMGLWAPAGGTLIARSDANGEDLEDYAGAGLYDSIPFTPLDEGPVDYASDRLFHDGNFRNELLTQLVEVGKSIQAAFGGQHQDIEGVYAGGKVYVVQARPQVMH